ncbi:MAG: hypothetical protein ACXWZ2_15835 [Mycobacterium sp.]
MTGEPSVCWIAAGGGGRWMRTLTRVNWTQLDFPTRAGFIATIMAILGVLVPPASVASACVAIAFSGFGWQRSRRRGESNRVARLCAIGCTALVVLIIVGSAVYGAAN